MVQKNVDAKIKLLTVTKCYQNSECITAKSRFLGTYKQAVLVFVNRMRKLDGLEIQDCERLFFSISLFHPSGPIRRNLLCKN